MKITLSWPAPELSPNARVHWAVKAKYVKALRAAAWHLAIMKGRPPTPTSRVLSVTFSPPDKRRRDLDNLIASVKGAIDGFSEALRVDDSEWELRVQKGQPIKGGAVVIEVLE